MDRIYELKPVFCEHIPEDIEHGILYISKEFGISVHLCACGCGGKTAMRFGRGPGEGWDMTEDNGLITFHPSVGNWSGENPHHAHYFIIQNKIQWC